MGDRFIIRRSLYGEDRVASSYAISRDRPVGKSLGGKFRFAKTSKYDAATFRSPETARKVLKSIRRTDPWAEDAMYNIVSV